MQRPNLPAHTIRLRPVEPRDLPALFEMQSDPQSNAMAGTKPRTREVFFEVWERNFTDPGVNGRVIELDAAPAPEIVGQIARFQADGHDSVGYWIARSHWGNSIVSRALAMFRADASTFDLLAFLNATPDIFSVVTPNYPAARRRTI